MDTEALYSLYCFGNIHSDFSSFRLIAQYGLTKIVISSMLKQI